MILIFHYKNQAVRVIYCQTAARLFINVTSCTELPFTGNRTWGRCEKTPEVAGSLYFKSEKFVRLNVIFGRENWKIVREEGFWRNLAAKMKKLSAKEDFAWERRSQAPGFFSKTDLGVQKEISTRKA